MLVKEIKIPMIVGMALYGMALLIDLCGVFSPDTVYNIMIAPFLVGVVDEFIFPVTSVFQIIIMVMYIVFFMVMLRYKGRSRRTAGIIMAALYCSVSLVCPYVEALQTYIASQLHGAEYLSSLMTMRSFIGYYTSPFVTISTVLLLISIGRYGVNNPNYVPDEEQG